jgi:hypothetical protein
MLHAIRRLTTACTIVVVVLMATQGTSGATSLSLRGAAGRFNTTTFQSLGKATDASANWTNKTAKSGRFSMQLTKNTDDQYAYAAAVVKGVEGLTVADLGTIGLSFKGACNGGSPRFNLFYDTDADGAWDGYTFYGCNNVTPTVAGDWSTVSFDPLAPPSGAGNAITGTATVVQLAVMVDLVGSVNIDDVTAAGSTVGEP